MGDNKPPGELMDKVKLMIRHLKNAFLLAWADEGIFIFLSFISLETCRFLAN